MYDRILVPTDGSNAATRAVNHAVRHATQYNAELHVIHVIDTVQTTSIHGADPDIWEQIEARGQTIVTTALAETDALTTEGKVITGTPRNEIVAYADDADIDLIIMGTHGRQGATRLLLGSVTEEVTRRSEIPVLAIPLT